MGKKWIYRLKKEDFAHVAQRPNVALEGRLDDMRKALSEYYSETEIDPQLVDIWDELEATYHDRAGPSITLTNAEGDNLVASLSIDKPDFGLSRELWTGRRSAAPRRWSGTQACHKHHGNQRDGSSGQSIGWKRYVKEKWVNQESRTLDPELRDPAGRRALAAG